jgi:hypothetical protein
LAEVGVGWASAEEVDRLGLVPATRLAMQRALACLSGQPDHLLIDHLSLPAIAVSQTSITFGDRRSLSIAAASVVAKVARDQAMLELDRQFPGYGFAHHKGYGTPEHQECLRSMGPSPVHRVSFAPIAQQRLPGLEYCRWREDYLGRLARLLFHGVCAPSHPPPWWLLQSTAPFVHSFTTHCRQVEIQHLDVVGRCPCRVRHTRRGALDVTPSGILESTRAAQFLPARAHSMTHG